MSTPVKAPCGSWKSPVTSGMVASGVIRFNRPLNIDNNNIYWAENRPAEGGRSVIVKWTPGGSVTDITPTPFNVRTRVHEYGGGAFTVYSGTIYFTNFSDQRFYLQEPGGAPQAITPPSSLRFADMLVDTSRNRIVCVCEDHTSSKVTNTIAAVDIATGKIEILVAGNDFYMSPRISPNGKQLAWLTWDHPYMPWDAAELWTGGITSTGAITGARKIAGGYNASACHPLFAPDGSLYFTAEPTGWWNLYRWKEGKIQSLCQMNAEFGVPLWGFGTSTSGFTSTEQLLCTYFKEGRFFLASLDTNSLKLKTVETPYSFIDSLTVTPQSAVFLGASASEPPAVIQLDHNTGNTQIIRNSLNNKVDEGYISTPREIEFPTENNLASHAFFYPPRNRDFKAAAGERPPLIVISHGGPTDSASDAFDLKTQFWTSRGFAVADVNYSGSTGYGREYRKRLEGQWGIVDVDDCVNCARYLIERGEVDEKRLIIRGASAGGYTTLAALAFRDVFKAGASYFGVSDLEALAEDTHKFESHYLDSLVGKYPEQRDIYVERSPINAVERLCCPVIFFQGSEDKVVPPSQAEKMVNALRSKGVPVAYLLFEGEQHGFRKDANIKRSLDAELYFYAKLFGFELADIVEPVRIYNL